MRKHIIHTGVLIFVLFLTACGNGRSSEKIEGDFYVPFDGGIEHIHGLGYAGNQDEIFFAAHDGLKIYKNNKWFKTTKQNNDYMGFNAVEQGFYTSGHPGEKVKLPNPLGLKRSLNNGQTLEDLAFEGESDFHVMGVGYKNHTIYVLNEHKNSAMNKGLYVSKDNGKSWTKVETDKFGKKISSIAVHPTNDEIVAIAAQEGVFLSKDGGESFDLLTKSMQGTSVFLSEDALWYGAYSNKPVLIKYLLDSDDRQEIKLPNMKEDAVMYLAQNPKDKTEIVFMTFNGNIYKSNDESITWNLLVKEGNIQ